jgi:serine/threonine protein kinase
MLVMKYYNREDLYSFLDSSDGIICWRDIVEMLQSMAEGINTIHELGLIHGNLHGGNVLIDYDLCRIDARIADTGLYRDIFQEGVFGVVPFVAPEVLSGSEKTQASDIYSFGMLMMMISAGSRPHLDRPHDIQLINDIKAGLRPQCPDDAPMYYFHLMERCLSNNPIARPMASEIYEIIDNWVYEICINPEATSVSGQFEKAEHSRFQMLQSPEPPPQTHPNAIYISRDINSI